MRGTSGGAVEACCGQEVAPCAPVDRPFRSRLDGDTAVVGAYLDDHADGNQAGSVYVYCRGGTVWGELQKLTASDAAANDQFGIAVGLSGDSIVVGAHLDNHSGQFDLGSAYVFRFAPGPPVAYCTAGTSASGCQALLSATGTASASAASGFSLQAVGVEGAKDGLFFWGANGQQANPWGNGTSFQCVVPPVQRGGLLVGSGTNGACDGASVATQNRPVVAT